MIGVVVPARNEARGIERCIASIRHAATHVREDVLVIVVADACTDGTAAISERRADAVLTTTAGCVGAARHQGSQRAIEAGCRWLAHTDADGRVPSSWLKTQLDAKADLFCGTVALGRSRWLSRAARERYAIAYHPFDDHRHVHGANLGISADAYRRLGGFAPMRAHEDVDLVERAQQSGLFIAWSAAAPVETSARLRTRAPEGFGSYLMRLGECV